MNDQPRGHRTDFSTIDEAKRVAEYEDLRRAGLSEAEAQGAVWPDAAAVASARPTVTIPQTEYDILTHRRFPWFQFAIGLIVGLVVGAAVMFFPMRAELGQAEKERAAVSKVADNCAAAADAWEGSAVALRESNTIMGDVASELLSGSFWSTDYSGIADDVDRATAKVSESNTFEADAPTCSR